MTARLLLLALALGVGLGAQSSAVGAPTLDLTVAPRVQLEKPVFVGGTAGEPGRLVIVVRNPNGRVIGRTVKGHVGRARFGALVRLDEGARPGPATVSAVLSGEGFEPVRAEARTEIVALEPNFLAAFPATWPKDTPVPVSGRIAFPGRLVIVVRRADGRPLGRVVVKVSRKGPFSRVIRLGPARRPGRVDLTATLRSGSLIARGGGSLVLT